MPSKISSLEQVALFRSLSVDEMKRLMARSERKRVAKGVRIVTESEAGDCIYVIEEGSFIASKDVGDGKSEILSLLAAGDCFGEVALIDRSPRSASVTAVEDSVIHSIRGSCIDRLFDEDPKLAAKIYRNFALTMTARLRNATDNWKRLAQESGRVRDQVDKMISEIVSVVSHELRTPVAVIRGTADLLDDVEMTPEQQKKFLGNIQEHTVRLSVLLDDLVQLEDVQFRQAHIEKNMEDVGGMIGEVVGELSELAGRRGVKIQVDIPASLPKLSLHRAKVKRALFHLVDNGIKYNREGGNLQISVSVDEDATPPLVVLSFKDDGPGIPPEKREDMFKTFHQAKGSLDKDRTAGMGVGLALSRSVALAHGGRLCVISPPGGGSVFMLTLPLE